MTWINDGKISWSFLLRKPRISQARKIGVIYQEYQHNPRLTNYINCYWTLSSQTCTSRTALLHFLTEGGGFSFNLSNPLDCIPPDQSLSTLPRSCLCGPLTQPLRIKLKGRVKIFGVRFRPGGAYPFFPHPPKELINFHGELDDLWEQKRLNLIDKIRYGCRNTQERIDFLNNYLSQYIDKAPKEIPAVSLALNVIDKCKGQVDIHRLSKSVGLSIRQLERRFEERIGMSPKQLCRNMRFKHVIKHLGRCTGDSWIDVALICGYYDQAHMIRDFKHYTSTSPGVYFRQPRALQRAVTAIF